MFAFVLGCLVFVFVRLCCLVSSIWYSMFGLGNWVWGIGYVACVVLECCIWYLVFGIKYSATGVQASVFGIRCLVFNCVVIRVRLLVSNIRYL